MSGATKDKQTLNPYIGPRTYRRNESDRFFGRDRESRELLSMVIANRVVIFYAPSGAGKSSLINTRLIPGLEEEQDFEVLPVGRVASGSEPTNQNDSASTDSGNLNPFVYSLMESLVKRGGLPTNPSSLSLSNFLIGLTKDGEDYTYQNGDLLSATTAESEESTDEEPPSIWPRVLIIDQFEEILTANLHAWERRPDFFEQLRQAMEDDPFLWVILSLREDYLAGLDAYAHLLPDSMRTRYRMERMDTDAAQQAIEGPANTFGVQYEEGVARRLAENLSLIRVPGFTQPQPGQYIEPAHLQVVCYRLWENLTKNGRTITQITTRETRKFADVDEELAAFYEEAIGMVIHGDAANVTEQDLRRWFGNQLIVRDSQTRSTLSIGKKNTGGLPNEIMSQLVEQRLLRTEERGGTPWVELAHDRLVNPILLSNFRWRTQNRHPLLKLTETWLKEGKRTYQLLFGEQLLSAQRQYEALNEELSQEEQDKIQVLLNASQELDQLRIELTAIKQRMTSEPQKYISEVGWGIIFPAFTATDYEKTPQV